MVQRVDKICFRKKNLTVQVINKNNEFIALCGLWYSGSDQNMVHHHVHMTNKSNVFFSWTVP